MQESFFKEKTGRCQIILVTGGAYQGKSEFARRLAEDLQDASWTVVEDLHLRIAGLLREKKDPCMEVGQLIAGHSHLILTVNELGCGVVPVDASDREWREVTGRICCRLAKEAVAVYRVTCGIPMKLK